MISPQALYSLPRRDKLRPMRNGRQLWEQGQSGGVKTKTVSLRTWTWKLSTQEKLWTDIGSFRRTTYKGGTEIKMISV